MKRIDMINRISAALILLSVLAVFGCAPIKQADAYPKPRDNGLSSALPTSPAPTDAPTEEPTPSPTAEPTPEPTAEPTTEPTATPVPLPPGYLSDEEKLMLVNFEHRLSDDFVPHDLVKATEYLGDICKHKYSGTMIQIEVADQLIKMLEAARDEGIKAKYLLVSAYRTQSMQSNLWNRRIRADSHYGDDPYKKPVGTMPYNASEHCAGLAVDVTSVNYSGVNIFYGRTKEAMWMRDNAYRFGFILRYEKEKESITGVHYEPWHFRYVGVEAATEIFESGVCLEEYLGLLPAYMSGNGGEEPIDIGDPSDALGICLPPEKRDESLTP